MVPLGAQWGNDPRVDSEATPGAPLFETWVNPNAPGYALETLGWGVRLSGPNDHGVNDVSVAHEGKRRLLRRAANSSCLSCHGTSQWNAANPANGMASFLMPLAPLQPQMPYTLVKAEREPARRKLAQSACVSFTRGTRITLATGEQRPIEDMRAGDRVLTRDDGIQQVRWVGQSTLRAVGDLAPILIRKGALNNANDLIVSPAHRLMVYQRSDEIGAGAPEILVRARDLVNGDTVVVLDGGFADYFQILFDRHHIIYAEGIAAESTFLDPVTRPVLPEDFWTARPGAPQGSLPAAHKSGAHGLDVSRSLLDRPDAVGLLKRASLR